MQALASQWAILEQRGLLVWFPSAATIKWLASTFQPTMKLVIEPAPATLLGWNCLESWVFNPITNFKLGWWVEASHLIVARFAQVAHKIAQCGLLCFNVGYLHNFPNLATIKWLASTHQPKFKLVIGLNTQLARQFQPQRMAGSGPTTNFMVGWKVQASHFIVAALGNHTSSHTLFQNGPLKRQGWHQGMQKDGRCWLNNQFHSGLKGWSQPFVWWQLGSIGTKMKECKEMVCPSSLSMSSHGTGPGSLSEVVPPPEASLINDQWLWIRTTWIMAALQKPEQISTDFTYNLKITIK